MVPQLFYRYAEVDGVRLFYREAGDPSLPKMVLLPGFPASSHQYRDLVPVLAEDFHVLAPDYPGFGYSDLPDPAAFAYTFDALSEMIESLLVMKGFTRCGMYLQDYGGPVGFRILTRHPAWLEWLTIQNTNAYEIGFTGAWDAIRHALWINPGPETEAALAPFLTEKGIKGIYLHGHPDPEAISPDNWTFDAALMERPNARRVQLDLLYDYRTNVALYPIWQAYLKQNQPKTLIFWGQNDVFFTREGGEAYLADLPEAEMHRLDSGHFAVEDSLPIIAENMKRFYRERVTG